MFKTGLVSVSFRSLSVDEIITLARDAGLEYIEWGTDVHAPVHDTERIEYIKNAQQRKGIRTSSLGTYFYLGIDNVEEIRAYARAAKALGTSILRIWCAKKGYGSMTEAERSFVRSEAKKAANIASELGVVLCLECHNNTYTDCIEGALDIMGATDSDSFLMYWQPNQFVSDEKNIEYARQISKYTKNIHVFNWRGKKRFPLSDAKALWGEYLGNFSGDETLLLEFMPDGSPSSLAREADALRDICIALRDAR